VLIYLLEGLAVWVGKWSRGLDNLDLASNVTSIMSGNLTRTLYLNILHVY
jgi:hypothetical protein